MKARNNSFNRTSDWSRFIDNNQSNRSECTCLNLNKKYFNSEVALEGKWANDKRIYSYRWHAIICDKLPMAWEWIELSAFRHRMSEPRVSCGAKLLNKTSSFHTANDALVCYHWKVIIKNSGDGWKEPINWLTPGCVWLGLNFPSDCHPRSFYSGASCWSVAWRVKDPPL